MGVKTIKRLLFFWVTSFASATLGFYILWLVMLHHYVFATWFRMYRYHYQHPIQYIAIPCFFYGVIATLYVNRFYKRVKANQVLASLAIAGITIAISSPFGGMLWNFHDMQAGYFPHNWFGKMVVDGTDMGLSAGWLIIGLSIPYNLLGLIVCFFLTKKGAVIFNKEESRN